MKVLVIASEGKFIDKPVNGGGPNPLCADAPQMTPAAGENQRTVGVLVSYNSFTYLNTIDIDWGTEMLLACPLNKLGHCHGLPDRPPRRGRRRQCARVSSARSSRRSWS